MDMSLLTMIILSLFFIVLANAEPPPSCVSTKESTIHFNCGCSAYNRSDPTILDEIFSLLQEMKQTVENTNSRLQNIEKFIGDIPTGQSGGKGWCEGVQCKNGGKCIGLNTCQCPSPYSGKRCERFRLGTKENPAPNAQAIQQAGDSTGNGLYWIQPPGETSPAMSYCDMEFMGGGWMLASYGYVATTTTNAGNKAIPNMNHPYGYKWLPNSRSSSNGVISLQNGAVHLAMGASCMIMAAGHNPDTGGIDQYSYVYLIDLTNRQFDISFANHNRYHGASGGGGIQEMHLEEFNVTALRGETGSHKRYALTESLGVTWADSYPTGYGFNEKKEKFPAGFYKGPFFPSVHSGDGHGSSAHGAIETFAPDVSNGHFQYVHKGWYTLSGTDQTGQTSIWFR